MLKKICLIFTVILIVCLTAGTALADGPPANVTKDAKLVTTLFTALIAAVFLIFSVMLLTRDNSEPTPQKKGFALPLVLFIAVALAIRVIVAITFEGYSTDVACFKGWSYAAFEQGPANFYTSGMFADYPPGYMYILYALGWVLKLLNIPAQSAIFTLIIKIPSMIAEVVTAIILYRIGVKQIGKMFGLMCSALVLFNPAMFFNSSAWGQIDAVFVLFIVLTLIYLRKENYWLGALFFAVALLIKPQAILFAPVVGLVYFYALFIKGRFGKAVLGIFGGAAIIAATVFLASLPFKGDQEPLWIVDKYISATSTYSYWSLNASNLFALFSKNFVTSSEPFLGLSYQPWIFVSVGLICAAIIVLQWRSRNTKPLFDLAAFLIISIYMFVPAMHERYILPVCILLIFAFAYSKEKATLAFAGAFAITATLTQMFTLYSGSVVAPHVQTLVVSAANIALYLAYAVITCQKLGSSKFLIKAPAQSGQRGD
jgi:dolichyl-phosphate-mannose-protein mannosyltransferase